MYRIKVATYLNPHLLWVEVLNESPKAVFEQIGVYGVLPLDVSFDTDGSLKRKTSEKWLPGASVVLKNTLADAKEIWFCPIFVDRSLSIFNNNVHKYGDIIVKKKNGQEEHVSIKLKDSVFAIFDIAQFHKELCLGKLQIPLNEIDTMQVVNRLKNYYNQNHHRQTWDEWFKDQKNNSTTVQNEEVTNAQIVSNIKKALREKHSNHLNDDKPKENMQKPGSGSVIEEILTNSDGSECSVQSSKMKLLKWKLRKIKEKTGYGYVPNFLGDTSSVADSTETDCEFDDEETSQHPSLNCSSKSADTSLEESLTENELHHCLNENINKYAQLAIKAQKAIKNESKKTMRLVYGPPDCVKFKNPTVKIVSLKSEDRGYSKTKQLEEKKIDPKHTDDNVVFHDVENPAVSGTENAETKPTNKCKNNLLLRRLQQHKAKQSAQISDQNEAVNTTQELVENNKVIEVPSDDESISDIIEQLNSLNMRPFPKKEIRKQEILFENTKINANPFKNLDGSNSVFVEKLISTVLMVHTKKNNKIQPCSNIRDVPFSKDITVVLRNMGIKAPTRMQTVSWSTILRGHSVFMIGPLGCGKTMGYLPAVCNLVSDSRKQNPDNVYPVAIILCATAGSVDEIKRYSKILFGLEERVFACYAGMDELTVTTSLLNGCDLLICTPPVLARLLQAELGVDLRALNTFVIDDCERISEVYGVETKLALVEVRKMLKNRANKELKVQFIVASRVWCQFLEPLAKKSPDTVICIGSFQECVLYSKSRMSVDFVKNEDKLNAVLKFLNEVAGPKRTVIVCRHDFEVAFLEESLRKLKHVIFVCNNTMTVHDLYNMNVAWGKYEDPILGPILICCDDNLAHLNITDAHYLLHYAMPLLFSTFSKRFSVLNDNYPSIFEKDTFKPRIQVLFEETNVEQLPKILNFVKRCANNVPDSLDHVSSKVLAVKDIAKAKKCVPLCDTMLSLGSCADFWYCLGRHSILKEYDEPKDWIPSNGYINFKILHYHSANTYSALLLSSTVKGQTRKYPQTYSTLSLKMGMYFSKESNRKLHGTPTVGDICAVSVKLNFFARCQVVKILDNYENGKPKNVLVRMIDEEKYERSSDIHLYHLPDNLREIETYVVQVKLANIRPLDKDVTYSELAKNHLEKITDTDENLYMRGQVALAIGNCVFVNTLEACQELSSLNDTVVRYNFKQELLNAHAEPNPNHIPILESLCKDLKIKGEPTVETEVLKPIKSKPEYQWAHLEENLSPIFWSSADNPDKFFVRLAKFNDCLHSLVTKINEYVKENPEPVKEINLGDIVLAKFPVDDMYERARIDVIDEKTVKCFFVDHGDYREIPRDHLVSIPDSFITQLPFQAIECRLIGVKPAGDEWTEFCTNWFYDVCLTNSNDDLKQLYVKYFIKSKAECTGGHKYGVAIIDTNSEQDVIVNQLMVDLNLAQVNEEETKYFDELNIPEQAQCNSYEDIIDDDDTINSTVSFRKMKQGLIRSVPLVASDDDLDEDQWDFNMINDFIGAGQGQDENVNEDSNKGSDDNTENNMAIVSVNKLPKENSLEVSNTIEDNNINTDSVVLSNHANFNDSVNESKKVEQEMANMEKFDEHHLNKPRLSWYQNKTSVTVKILLLGVETYVLEIKERSINFFTQLNSTKYGFQFNLYGAVNLSRCSHANKGQYILVKLTKMIQRNWLTLTKDPTVRKWIVYDVDRIDTPSSDEEPDNSDLVNAIKNLHQKYESDTEDDEFADDVTFANKRYA